MNFKQLGIFLIVSIFIAGCSADKNTFINRVYHGTTAKYNGLYNANELLYTSLKSYKENKKEDFFNILPLTQVPSEEEVMALYPAIDTAISKCKRVISLHSMPSIDKPSKKKAEHNRWIDENYIVIGRAMYFRRDFDESIKNFEFVRKFFKDDPSNYYATLWIARNQLQLGEVGKAKVNLDLLDAAVSKTEEQAEEAKKGSKSSSKKKTSARLRKIKKAKEKRDKEKEEKKGLLFVPFPEKLKFDLNITKGEYYIAKKDYEQAIIYLEESLKYGKKKELGRVRFVIGQLYEKQKNDAKAAENYTAVLKYNTTFEVNFTARMNRAMTGGNEKIKKELHKMSRDAKNFEYRDQIFYALAEIDMRANNRENALKNYNKSIFYSISNNRQKGRTYERLADINYTDKNYIQAQRYYDSCAKLVNDQYPNYEEIVKKAEKLKKLVQSIEIAEYEDSVQRIAKMSPEEQLKFAENLIKKMKEDAEKQKNLVLQRQKELTTTGAITSNSLSGSKNYFTNQKLKSQGFEDFRKQWGYRQNEDDWRRSDKMVIATFEEIREGDDSTEVKSSGIVVKETGPTPEELLVNIPSTDSALDESNKRYVEARYDAGMIYKEQLNENGLATQQFQYVIDKNYESDFNPMSSFQLYKIYEDSDPSIASNQRNYILTNYPKSDYAAYLNDPDFFVKRKKVEAIYEQEYLRYLDRYNRGLYYAVLGKAEDVITNEKDNKYRSKYMIIKALCLGQMNDDKTLLIPILEQVKEEYPSTSEATKADEMLNIIKNGYSKNETIDFSKKNTFKYTEDGDFWFVIEMDKEAENKIFTYKNKVTDFNARFFSKLHLTTETKLMGDKNVITVKTTNFKDAKAYITKFKSSQSTLGDVSKFTIFYISKENIIKLFENGKIDSYLDFFFEKY